MVLLLPLKVDSFPCEQNMRVKATLLVIVKNDKQIFKNRLRRSLWNSLSLFGSCAVGLCIRGKD